MHSELIVPTHSQETCCALSRCDSARTDCRSLRRTSPSHLRVRSVSAGIQCAEGAKPREMARTNSTPVFEDMQLQPNVTASSRLMRLAHTARHHALRQLNPPHWAELKRGVPEVGLQRGLQDWGIAVD